LVGGRLAEPSHGAVEMMQLKRLSALDPVVGSPLFRGAVRARHKQPVELSKSGPDLDRWAWSSRSHSVKAAPKTTLATQLAVAWARCGAR
jgi:hypothetical protein